MRSFGGGGPVAPSILAARILAFVVRHPLNERRRVAALARLLRWQAGSLLVPGRAVVEWVNGARLVVGRGDTGLTGNVYCGLHEFEHMGFLLHLLRAEDLFIDVGANAGSYTVLAGAGVGARVVAVEPVESTFRRLLDNVAMNHLQDRVTCLNVGLGDREGTLRFSADEDCSNHVITEGEAEVRTVTVAVRRLDDVMTAQPATLLKIDVEGYETVVLGGATETLASPSLLAVILELTGCGARYGFDEDNTHRMMQSHGFGPYRYEPRNRQVCPAIDRNRIGNTLYLRAMDVVVERCRTAPPFSVFGRRI